MLFYTLCTTRKCNEIFCDSLFRVVGIFFILWSDCYKNLKTFNENYLFWHTRVTTVIFYKNHEQQGQNVGITHSCHEILHLRTISPGWVILDPGSIFFISLQKITQLIRYFVCYSYSYCLRINRNHWSVIKNTQCYNGLYTPGSKRNHVVLMRVNNVINITNVVQCSYIYFDPEWILWRYWNHNTIIALLPSTAKPARKARVLHF